MSESNHVNSEAPIINAESDNFGVSVNQTYETSKGNKFKVTSIARESGNIEDFFVVYKKILQDSSNEGRTEQSWVKNINELENLQGFDDTEYPEVNEQKEEVSIGQRYQHFKTKDFYIIKDVARDPTNPSKMYVIYEGQYNSPEFGDHPIWIREYEDFTGMKVFKDSELDENGNKREPVKRFALVS
jgi:hypothetical protein